MTTPGNELAALADRISVTPAYTADDLHCWRKPILHRCDQPDGNDDVSVILIDAGQRDAIVTALRLAATRPDAGAVKVKPLEWSREKGTAHVPETWRAKSIGREYDIQRTGDGKFDLWADAGNALSIEDSLETAKAAAQADYEQRIRSALELPAKAAGGVLEALELAIRFIGQTSEYKTGHTGAAEIVKAGIAALAREEIGAARARLPRKYCERYEKCQEGLGICHCEDEIQSSDGGVEGHAERQVADGLYSAGRGKAKRTDERPSLDHHQVGAGVQTGPQSLKATSAGIKPGPSEPSAPSKRNEPVAWQWRYIGNEHWKTPSGGQKLTPDVIKRERPIEQRPLYTRPAAPVDAEAIKDLVASFHRNSCYPEAMTGELNEVAAAIAQLVAEKR